MLRWVNQFSTCCFLDSHDYYFNNHTYECIAGAGVRNSIELPAGNALVQLSNYQQIQQGWLFGHLGYDLKNEIESLASNHSDHIQFPDLFFFAPQTIILLNHYEICIDADNAEGVWAAVCAITDLHYAVPQAHIFFQQRFSKQQYVDTIEKLRHHILRGDCYEVNFCQEFFAEGAAIDPVEVYIMLSKFSPAPFAAFYKVEDKYLLCASPERYLKKAGNTIISQPIKGTARRSIIDKKEDNFNKQQLYHSSKERAENVMVVDLVRNDLSKFCTAGSVKVDELFGVYSFPQVHQLVSTVSGTLPQGVSFSDIIRHSFPMGSMTGAPKKKVMQLIEQYETVKRGIFSGALGYIAPGGDFDFNVVIRSILYNERTRYLSYLVGSGITFYSNAEEEYQECLLKAEAIRKVFD